jgi:hypothetical protein
VYTTGKEIRDMMARYGPTAPPDLRAVRAVSEKDIHETAKELTRRTWLVAAGLSALGVAGVTGGIMNENRKRKLSSVTFPHLNYEADLRDPGFLEPPKGGRTETVPLPSGRLMALATPPELQGGHHYDFIFEYGDVGRELASSRFVLNAGRAYYARLPEGRGLGSRLAVHQGHVEYERAIGEFEKEMRRFASGCSLQEWLRSPALWRFMDTVRIALGESGAWWAREVNEDLRRKLTLALPGFGPYCLADAAMLLSQNGEFVLCNLPMTYDDMVSLYEKHPLPEQIDEGHPLRIRKGPKYKCILLCEPQSFQSDNPQFLFFASPVVAGTHAKLRRYSLSESSRSADLHLTRDDRDVFEILSRFHIPNVRTSSQQIHPIRIPRSFSESVDEENAKPARATFEALSAVRGLIFRPDRTDPDFLRPDQQKNLWWPSLISNLRLWDRAWAQSAVDCGAKSYDQVRGFIEGF